MFTIVKRVEISHMMSVYYEKMSRNFTHYVIFYMFKNLVSLVRQQKCHFSLHQLTVRKFLPLTLSLSRDDGAAVAKRTPKSRQTRAFADYCTSIHTIAKLFYKTSLSSSSSIMPNICQSDRSRYLLSDYSRPECPQGIAYRILQDVDSAKAAEFLADVTVIGEALDLLKLNKKCETELLLEPQKNIDLCKAKGWTPYAYWIQEGWRLKTAAAKAALEKAKKKATKEF